MSLSKLLKSMPSTTRGPLAASSFVLELINPYAFSADPEAFRRDLVNIARTTLSSKVLAADKDYFANLAVDAVLRLKVRTSVLARTRRCSRVRAFAGVDRPRSHPDHQEAGRTTHGLLPGRGIHPGQEDRIQLPESDEGRQDSRRQHLYVLSTPIPLSECAYTSGYCSAMDTDKVKIFGARVRVEGTGKLAELERAERVRATCSMTSRVMESEACFGLRRRK